MEVLPADILAHLGVHDPLGNLLVLALNLFLPDGPPPPVGPHRLLTDVAQEALAREVVGNGLLHLVPPGSDVLAGRLYTLLDVTVDVS